MAELVFALCLRLTLYSSRMATAADHHSKDSINRWPVRLNGATYRTVLLGPAGRFPFNRSIMRSTDRYRAVRRGWSAESVPPTQTASGCLLVSANQVNIQMTNRPDMGQLARSW